MKNIIALFILIACDYNNQPQITLPNTETRIINSKENNIAYNLFVSLPEGYNKK